MLKALRVIKLRENHFLNHYYGQYFTLYLSYVKNKFLTAEIGFNKYICLQGRIFQKIP